MLDITTTGQSNLPIKIDGKDYEMKSYGALAFGDYLKIQNFTDKYKNLTDKDMTSLKDDEIDTLSNTMEGLVTLILVSVPKEVIQRLNAMNKLAIINHFLETVPKEVGTSQENTGKLSQDLQGTMEGMPTNG